MPDPWTSYGKEEIFTMMYERSTDKLEKIKQREGTLSETFTYIERYVGEREKFKDKKTHTNTQRIIGRSTDRQTLIKRA